MSAVGLPIVVVVVMPVVVDIVVIQGFISPAL